MRSMLTTLSRAENALENKGYDFAKVISRLADNPSLAARLFDQHEMNDLIKLAHKTTIYLPKQGQDLREWMNERFDAIEEVSGRCFDEDFRQEFFGRWIEGKVARCEDENHTCKDTTIFLFNSSEGFYSSERVIYAMEDAGKVQCDIVYHLCLAGDVKFHQRFRTLLEGNYGSVVSLLESEEKRWRFPRGNLCMPGWVFGSGGGFNSDCDYFDCRWDGHDWFVARSKQSSLDLGFLIL